MKPGELQIQLLGALSLSRDGVALTLPGSRKVRGLLAYLALNPGGAARSALCDLLWENPNDPRAELRWCLSKIRSVLDDSTKARVETANDRICIDVTDCFVDALEVDRMLHGGVAAMSIEQLRSAARLFKGEFLEGLSVDGNARFNGWLLSQRHRYKANQLSVIEKLSNSLTQGSDEHFSQLQAWLQLAPFDQRAHEAMMLTLAKCGRAPDAEAHLVSAIRQFEAEGLEWLSLREAWRQQRAQQASAGNPKIEIGSPVSKISQCPLPQAISTQTSQAQLRSSLLNAPAPANSHRVSVAVMPFIDSTTHTVQRGGIADGLVEDIITQLAKLRAFFVIARGTVFALDDHKIGAHEAGRILNVNYVVSGSVRRLDNRIAVKVELVETSNARIQWADEFECAQQDAFTALDGIGDRIVAAVAEEIEAAERNRAALKPPNSLDAWEAYHRGLWHMYKFNDANNDQAEHFFRTAVQLDPTFARAYAGLSFTHFQNAFLHRVGDRALQTDLAYRTAGESLMVDDRDPAAHWAMGRALWLRGEQDESLRELSRSVELSPNFALGHYTLGFVHCQSGDPQIALDAVDYSRTLSPFDPLQFAMLATNALAHVRMGNYDESVSWAIKAAARPNAHTHILSIATHCLAVAGRVEEARTFAALIRKNLPNYRVDDFLASFHFDKDTADLFRRGAARIGLG